jgi:NAD(P)-dependent dehydrogenase (short-subunit alcohol dehydrogenase family)
LSPGYIRTAMTDGLLATRPDLEEEWLRGSMLDRLSTPDEYRGPVIFLLSKASSFTTGADLIVDGGHTAF